MEDVRTLRYDIQWEVFEGMQIVDINSKYYDMVIEFMWSQSFLKSLVYESLGLFDLPNMKETYSWYVRHILRNECSVMMISEDETQIRAVGLLEWMTEEWHSWVFFPSSLPRNLFQQIIMMKKELIDATKASLGVSTYDALFVHEIAFPDELYFNQDFLATIFDVFGFVAQHMHMPRVHFIALSSVDQEAASLIEYEEVGRTIYSIYKVGNTRPFDILRELDEMYALLFELAVSPVQKYIEMPGFEAFHEALDARLAKEAAEKRHDDDI
ncbi:uncharacterized protein LOC6542558 isoform X2 [Drosophila erecta]|uniref:Uncharacterized protein, isoform B n=1 Tax=Drosophila erecta TaxID=7220 RepID=B3N5X7_DROER|nr:uncharacterized protein LOC6542558 isoform X2 [Drosophila erecta]EDV59136.2 uncharacterized protein Dere_GG23577, isoform B [Drosophila erecta]KQS70648.1 uncharacterized protein Dere_GG23577, isoform C [Drosophila erecta]